MPKRKLSLLNREVGVTEIVRKRGPGMKIKHDKGMKIVRKRPLGMGLRSRGKGRGLGRGFDYRTGVGRGPIGVPNG